MNNCQSALIIMQPTMLYNLFSSIIVLVYKHKLEFGRVRKGMVLTPVYWLYWYAGMVDIARQTVEFLYEENGGIPRDLYLPTIEDIKDEANKFTTDKVRKGTLNLILHL